MEQKVGILKYARVNRNNLILNQDNYCKLLKRGALTCFESAPKAQIVKNDTCVQRIAQKEREKEARKLEEELSKQEIDFEVCIEKEKRRKKIIDLAKEIIKRDNHETKLLNRAILQTEINQQRKEQLKAIQQKEEAAKKRDAEMELKFIEGEKQEDEKRKDNAKKKRIQINDENILLTKENLMRREELKQEDKIRGLEVLRLTKEFELRRKKSEKKNFSLRRQLDADNRKEIENKTKLHFHNATLEATEARDARMFLEAKKQMYEKLDNKDYQQELREKRLDLVVNRTKNWIRKLDPEGVRDRWYTDLYCRDLKAKEEEEVKKVKKKKDDIKKLVSHWDEQISLMEAKKCEEKFEDKMCLEVRIQMDCQMKEEDQNFRKMKLIKDSEEVQFNMRKEQEKKQAELAEKLNDKKQINKLYEHFDAKAKEAHDRKRCLIEKYKTEGKDTTVLERLHF